MPHRKSAEAFAPPWARTLLPLAISILGLAGPAGAQDSTEDSLDPESVARAALQRAEGDESSGLEWLEPTDGGLTSDQAARLAVETAPSVRRAEAAGSRARAVADGALSRFAPRVELGARYARINEVDLPPFEIPGFPATDNPFPQILNFFGVSGSIAIPVTDFFLTILPAYEGASGFAEAARHQVDVERQQIALRARESYYEHVRARGSLWVAEQAVSSIEATMRDVEGVVAAGAGSRADLAQVRAQLASARAAVVQSRGAVRVTERALRQLMHLPRGREIAIGEDILRAPRETPPSEETLVSRALEQRAEVRAIRALVEARQAIVRSRVGEVIPRVVLTGAIETASPNQRVIPQTTDFFTTWAVGGAVSWSPNDLAIGLHRIDEAEAEVSEVREDLAQLEDAVTVEAAQAVASYEAASESIAAAEEAVAATELSLEDRRAMLSAGVATTTEVMQAQLELTRAQLQLVGAHVDRHLAAARAARVVDRAYVPDGR